MLRKLKIGQKINQADFQKCSSVGLDKNEIIWIIIKITTTTLRRNGVSKFLFFIKNKLKLKLKLANKNSTKINHS